MTLVEKVRAYRKLEQARARRDLNAEESAQWEALKQELEQRLLRQGADANRRENSRVSVSLNVQFVDQPAFRNAYIRNLSGGGVFIETDNDAAINTEIRVNMDFGERSMEVTGLVVWKNETPSGDFGRGIGLRFVNLTPDQAQFIHSMVFRVMEKEAQQQEEK